MNLWKFSAWYHWLPPASLLSEEALRKKSRIKTVWLADTWEGTWVSSLSSVILNVPAPKKASLNLIGLTLTLNCSRQVSTSPLNWVWNQSSSRSSGVIITLWPAALLLLTQKHGLHQRVCTMLTTPLPSTLLCFPASSSNVARWRSGHPLLFQRGHFSIFHGPSLQFLGTVFLLPLRTSQLHPFLSHTLFCKRVATSLRGGRLLIDLNACKWNLLWPNKKAMVKK